MKKMILIFIVIAVLLSGCISGGSKSGSNKSGGSGDEYGIDNTVEETDSGIVQADYHSLDLNNKGSKVSNVKSEIHTNVTVSTVDKTVSNTSLETIKG